MPGKYVQCAYMQKGAVYQLSRLHNMPTLYYTYYSHSKVSHKRILAIFVISLWVYCAVSFNF